MPLRFFNVLAERLLAVDLDDKLPVSLRVSVQLHRSPHTFELWGMDPYALAKFVCSHADNMQHLAALCVGNHSHKSLII